MLHNPNESGCGAASRGLNMANHRYSQLIVPMDRYVRRMTPKARKMVALLEGSLLLILFTSVVFYVQ